jgi:hypothetical protein
MHERSEGWAAMGRGLILYPGWASEFAAFFNFDINMKSGSSGFRVGYGRRV